MTEISGTLKRYDYAQHRRSRHLLADLVQDLIDPLPPRSLWVIEVPDPTSHRGYRIYKARSGKCPTALDGIPIPTVVHVRATIEPWSNGLGGYMSRVKLVGLR